MIKIANTAGAPVSWLLKMAWRDGKASGKRLLLSMASIVLGIAAVVSVQSFSSNLKDNIALQSKALMGADYRIDSNQPANARVMAIMDSLGGYGAKEVKFVSMAAFPGKKGTKLVQVRGVEGPFPFYGDLETDPPMSAKTYKRLGGALVDATVMVQFGLKVGDSVKLGTTFFPITAALNSAPGSNALGISVAPPIIVPFAYMEPSGLLQKGSRLDYNYYFNDPDADLERLNRVVDPLLQAENADMDTHIATSRRLGRRYGNVGKFLNLVAFIALLLGCVGIASSVHIYIKEKIRSVAILKCLGATRGQSFLIYLFQIAGMGFAGGILGTLLGLLLQQLFPLVLQEFLPFTVTVKLASQSVVMGLVLGVAMAVLFALLPLVRTWFVSPLQALRVQDSDTKGPMPVQLGIVLAIFAFVYGFAYWLLGNATYAMVFVMGILVVFLVLGGAASLFMWAIKRYFPRKWGFAARHSMLNLFRPNNQTIVLVMAIGIGTFLIGTLYFTKDFLLEKTSLETGAQSPNMILFDVQTPQKDALAGTITPMGLKVLGNIPIVTMRLEKIKDRTVNQIREDSTATVNRWILSHEFRVTYRDTLIGSETLVRGALAKDVVPGAPVPISLSDNVAKDAQVTLGDTLLFNVQGALMETVVGSIRAVDWGRVQLNFSVLFPTGVLEKAPQFHVLTTHVPNKLVSARLQQEVVRKFPNVSILDLRQVIVLIDGILDKIAWVISFMAFFSILTGIIVLIGSVRNSKRQRIMENVLLRTLGAQSHQIIRITALEYLYLGLLGSSLGLLLSLIGSLALAYFMFETPFVPSWVPFVLILPGITVLVLLVGVLNNRSVLNSAPLQVLRAENNG